MRTMIAGLVLIGLHVAPGQLPAQLPETRLFAVSPPGAQRGTTVEVTLSAGADLDDVDQLVFSHPGITASQKTQEVHGQTKPVASTFNVSVAEDVPPGMYDVRAIGLYGVSNARTFVVGHREEVAETEDNNTQETAQQIALNQVVNAKADSAADLDYFKFEGTEGQHVVVEAIGSRIDSRLDAVIELYSPSGRRLASEMKRLRFDPSIALQLPETGQYTVKVRDFTYRGGAEYFYRLTASTEPYIEFVLPPAGQPGTTATYTLYGRNLPGSTPAEQSIDGTPLEKLDVEITLPESTSDNPLVRNRFLTEADVGGFFYSLSTETGESNRVLIQYSASPVVFEAEPNDDPTAAQTVAAPGELAGQFQSRSDVDYFEFDAKANDVWIIESFAQRLGNSADVYLKLEQVTVDDQGKETVKQIAAVDDDDAQLYGNVFDSRTDDPTYRFQVPADGKYRISVRDRYFEARGNPGLVYRLSLRKPQPDFRLIAMPHRPPQGANKLNASRTITLRRGSRVPVRILVENRDGFSGEIDLHASGLPEGVTVEKAVVSPGSSGGPMLIFHASKDAAEWAGPIEITGTAKIGDEEVTRTAMAGAIIWDTDGQTAAESRQVREIMLAVTPETAPFEVSSDVQELDLHQSRQVFVPVKLQKRDGFDNDVTLTFTDVPGSSKLQVENKPIKKGEAEGQYRIFVPADAPAGVYTVFLQADGQVSYQRNPMRVERAKSEQERLAQESQAATDAATKAATDRDAAVKQAEVAAQQLKAAQEGLTSAEKTLADASAALETALAEKKKLDDEGDKVDADAKAVAEKKATDAQAAAKSAEEAVTKAKEAVAAAQKAEAEATKMRNEAEARTKQFEAQAKMLTDAKAAADKEVEEATKAAAPANRNYFPPSSPLTIRVLPAPVKLAGEVPNSGAVKQGESIDLKITVTRANGFEGPVTLSLPLPPGVAGLTAEEVTITPDQTEGVIKVQAAADAAEGKPANLVVRAKAGEAFVDVPVEINISK